MDNLLKTSEVAELLNVSRGAVRRWIARKLLPARRLNGHWRVNRVDALKMMEVPTGTQPTLPVNPKTVETLRKHGFRV